MDKSLENLIAESQKIVFFGGAGVSTESGIPDFRSVDGLYSQKYKYPPEKILSHSFFMDNTQEFYEFYKNKMICLTAKPNQAHLALATLEKLNKLTAVITQNIDGLHQLGGAENVFELHGSVQRNYCMRCNKFYDVNFILNSLDIPRCECGGIIKPDVVLYEESLDDGVVSSAIKHIKNADMLIIGGTSLGVYPAAGLIDYYHGNKLVLINKSSTPIDAQANLVINDSIGKILGEAVTSYLENQAHR
ncbi:NAD-dependent protein deacylase [Desulfovibrio litoralis]|uniref:NAD-dependent protein deacetylase n=1 Tax=Desulfovibrio litoralis DSM 11393 TaxID=1121455 RepID=A0A1M7T325_9BACT|nr:NAD-dependent protein deacylase [Desulfovibrio litoralis]SHN65044.1 NAD-dependent deacetylase [Desulfovibrio litoralis DSM 11393]